jgi:hypothetical protein
MNIEVSEIEEDPFAELDEQDFEQLLADDQEIK